MNEQTAAEKGQWEKPAELLRIISHPVRLMILDSLNKSPQCIKDLNSLVPVVQPHLSQHMAALRRAKLVDFYVSGTLRCYYVVRPSFVRRMICLIQQEHPIQKRDRAWVLRKSKKINTQQGKRSGVPSIQMPPTG